MPETEDNILDRIDKKKHVNWFDSPWLYVLSTPLVILGAMFKLQHWPAANILLITGFTITVVRAVAMIVSGTRMIHESLFLISQVAVVLYLVLRFVFDYNNPYVRNGLLIVFALGFLTHLLTKQVKRTEGVKDDDEDLSEE